MWLAGLLTVLLIVACGVNDTGTGQEGGAVPDAPIDARANPTASSDCPDCLVSSDGTVQRPPEDGQDVGGGSMPGYSGSGKVLCPPPTVPRTGAQATPKGGVSCDPVSTTEPGTPCKPGLDEVAGLGRALVGCVLDANGRPVVNAFLDFEALTATGPIPDIGVLTDEHGRYAHTMLPPGRYSVTIRAEGYKTPPRKSVMLEDDTVNADFVLERE